MPYDALATAVRDSSFGEGCHAVMQGAGEPQNRQCQRRTRAFAEAEIEVEQRARLERVEHEPMALLRGAMRENQVRTAGRIEPENRERRHRGNEAVDQHGNATLPRSDDRARERRYR